MYSNYSPSSEYLGSEQDTMNSSTEDHRSCALTPMNVLQEDIKPTICVHGYTVETCTVPECATFEISKILDTLQNFERNVEGTSPLAADKPVFDFEGPQPTSPSQWEDFSFDMSVMPTSALPGQLSTTGPLGLGLPQPPHCGAGSMLLQDGGNLANQRASESPGLHDAVLRCRIQRDRHPSSSMSEGYSSDHTAPSPGPNRQMIPVEIEKRERRKEQNRRAARKCRIKKRAQTVTMASEFRKLECDNTQLKFKVQNLEKEKKQLEEILRAHMATCNLRLHPD